MVSTCVPSPRYVRDLVPMFTRKMQISANTDPNYCAAYHLRSIVPPMTMVFMSRTSKTMNESFGYYLTANYFKDALIKSLDIKRIDPSFQKQGTGFFRRMYVQSHDINGDYVRALFERCMSRATKEMCEFFLAAESEEVRSKLRQLTVTSIRRECTDNIRLLYPKLLYPKTWEFGYVKPEDARAWEWLTFAVHGHYVKSLETMMDIGFLTRMNQESEEKAITIGRHIIESFSTCHLLPKFLRGTTYKFTSELATCIKKNLQGPFTDILTHALHRVPEYILNDLTRDVYEASKPDLMQVLLDLDLLKTVSGNLIAHLTLGRGAKLGMFSLLLSMNIILVTPDCATRAIQCKNPQFVRELHSYQSLLVDSETIQAALNMGDVEIILLVLSVRESGLFDIAKIKWGDYGYEITKILLDRSYADPPPLIPCNIDTLRAVLDSTRECGYSDDYLSKELLQACAIGCTEAVKLLLEHGAADPAYKDSACLLEAASTGRRDIVKMLLEDYRADPLTFNELPIRKAYIGEHMSTVNEFLWDMRTTYTLDTL